MSLRAEGDTVASPTTIFGYTARFDQPSEPLGPPGMRFIEVLKPGCFTRTLIDADVPALWNHNTDIVLGRTSSGTLRLVEDDEGLAFECDLGSNVFADMARDSVMRRDIQGCSFGFCVVADNLIAPEKEGDLPIREILECELIEISPCVTFPAYLSTQVDVRCLDRLPKVRSRTPRRDRASRILKLM